jgi:hypothetical protein
MPAGPGNPSMNQKIFEMGLPVEAVSLYLLCCGLEDLGTTVSTNKISEIWNGSPELLQESIHGLAEKNILQPVLSAQGSENAVFRILPPNQWKDSS